MSSSASLKRNNLSNEKEEGKEKKEVELLLLSVSNDEKLKGRNCGHVFMLGEVSEDCCTILLSRDGDVGKSSGCDELDKGGVRKLQKDRVVEKGVFDSLCTYVGDEGGGDSKAWTSTMNTDIVHVDSRDRYTAMIMVGQFKGGLL